MKTYYESADWLKENRRTYQLILFLFDFIKQLEILINDENENFIDK